MVEPGDVASSALSVTHVGEDEQYEDLVSPVQEEDTDIDRQTKAIEFHGSTSSIALLRDLQISLGRLFQGSHRQQQQPGVSFVRTGGGGSSSGQRQQPSPFLPGSGDPHGRLNLVSELRNTSFAPRAGTEGNATMQQRNLYVKEAQYFIDAYFQNFHFIHPFIDKEIFRRRVADMWAMGDPACDMCFFCTYLSLMSLGALIGEWEWEEDRLGGLSRFEWSRKLFDEALANLADLHFPANLDTVHCLYLCAKVCQNELNHNMAYLYSGFAVRICLTAGFNQDNGGGGFSSSGSPSSSSQQISRTWWGLYSLEMELSFALGRPDTLGLDEYHDRPLSPVDDSELAIIPLMVDFARIVRRIAIGIYHSRTSWQQKMARAQGLERELDGWIAGLPARIRPACSSSSSSTFSSGGLAALRQPKWCRRQKIITEIRYHNVRMLLFRPFLSMLPTRNNSGTPPPGVAEAVDKCIASAKRTIEIVHEAMVANSFFRTWWDNTMHILFATAVLLLHTSRGGGSQAPIIAPQVEVAVEILEAMDECMVARKSANIIRHMLAQVKGQPAAVSQTMAEFDNDKNLEPHLGDSITMDGNDGSEFFMNEDSDFVRRPFVLRSKCHVDNFNCKEVY